MIYESCPTGYEVDHVIAISEGGKHHEDNLQYLPAMENRRKNRTQNYDRSLVVRWQDVVKV
jgi:5-methylcytosine-specific restriction endonuclease McrA